MNMKYYVNNEKKSALVRQLFNGSLRQTLMRYVACALAAFAVLNALFNVIYYRTPGALPASQFALCIFLLAASFVLYGTTLFAAYKRVRDYSYRKDELLELGDRKLRYSYYDAHSHMIVQFEIPISELHNVERHVRMPLWRLTGEFELKLTFKDLPEEAPAVTTAPGLMLGDYFEGIDDLQESLSGLRGGQ